MIKASLSDPFYFYRILKEPTLYKAWNILESLLPEWGLFENFLKNAPEKRKKTYMDFLNKILDYALENSLIETEDDLRLYDKISDAIFFIDYEL